MQLSLFDDRDPSGDDTDILAQLRQSMDELDAALAHPDKDSETASNFNDRTNEILFNVKQSGKVEDDTVQLDMTARAQWNARLEDIKRSNAR